MIDDKDCAAPIADVMAHAMTHPIEQFLKDSGWSQSGLARRARIAQASISYLCTGQRKTVDAVTASKIIAAAKQAKLPPEARGLTLEDLIFPQGR